MFYKSEKQPKMNVIGENEFKQRVANVFDMVAGTVMGTLGPYGYNTIVEEYGEPHVTKDGWTVLKGIKFDTNVDNNILALMTRIAHQVVHKVGDGSTSSVVGAHSMYRRLYDSNILSANFAPSDFCELLSSLVETIEEEVLRTRTLVITDEYDGVADGTIFDLAMISTNSNTVVSEIIDKIYKETRNPAISFVKGKYRDHSCEIIEGYKFKARLMDEIYFNDLKGQCNTTEQPLIVLFDHRLSQEHYDEIIIPIKSRAIQEGKKLFIFAPDVDTPLLDRISHQANIIYRSNPSNMVEYLCRPAIFNNHARSLYGDFATMLGTQVINDSVARVLINKDADKEGYELEKFIGTCGTMTIDMENCLIQDLTNINETMYEICLAQAKAILEQQMETDAKKNLISQHTYELKERCSKLMKKMGIIYVGGKNSMEQQANYDLVEDAVKACESAFINGYNVGCNLAVPFAVSRLLNTMDPEDTREDAQKIRTIMLMISESFVDVYRSTIYNKYKHGAKQEDVAKLIDEVLTKTAQSGLPVDLRTGELSNKIINPTSTDIEILKAASSIVSLILTSNQYLTILLDPTMGED